MCVRVRAGSRSSQVNAKFQKSVGEVAHIDLTVLALKSSKSHLKKGILESFGSLRVK